MIDSCVHLVVNVMHVSVPPVVDRHDRARLVQAYVSLKRDYDNTTCKRSALSLKLELAQLGYIAYK